MSPVKVHRFDGPQKVSIGSGGWALSSCQINEVKDEEPTNQQQPESQAEPATNQPSHSAVGTSAAANGPRFTVENLTKNGNKFSNYFWSQDKQQVVLSIPVPQGTRAKAVQAVIREDSVSVKLNGEQLVGGKTRLPVDTDDDYSDWEIVDWEKSGEKRRLVRVTLVKKAPAGGIHVVLWWPKLFDSEPEIDVESIPERSKNFAEHQKVWKDAHTKFQEQMGKIEAVEVPVAGSEVMDVPVAGSEAVHAPVAGSEA